MEEYEVGEEADMDGQWRSRSMRLERLTRMEWRTIREEDDQVEDKDERHKQEQQDEDGRRRHQQHEEDKQCWQQTEEE